MNKFAKVMISGVLIGGLLSACSTNTETKSTNTSENKAPNKQVEMASDEAPSEDLQNGILHYRESAKGGEVIVSADSAQFYNPNPDIDKPKSKNSRFVLVCVTVKNAKDDSSPVTPIGLNFTLKDQNTGKSYDWGGEVNGSNIEASPWGNVFDDTLQKDDFVTAIVPFEVPKGNDNVKYMLHVTYDSDEYGSEDMGKWRIDDISSSKF